MEGRLSRYERVDSVISDVEVLKKGKAEIKGKLTKIDKSLLKLTEVIDGMEWIKRSVRRRVKDDLCMHN